MYLKILMYLKLLINKIELNISFLSYTKEYNDLN